MCSAPLAVGGGVSMDQICSRVLLRSKVYVPCSAHACAHLSSSPSMDGLSGMLTACCWEEGWVMARSSQTAVAPHESVCATSLQPGAARLGHTGIDPVITGEPPEERLLPHAMRLGPTRTGRVGPSAPRTRAVGCRPQCGGCPATSEVVPRCSSTAGVFLEAALWLARRPRGERSMTTFEMTEMCR